MGSVSFANYQTLKLSTSFNSFFHSKQPCIVSLYHHSHKVVPSLSLPKRSTFYHAAGLISNFVPVTLLFIFLFFLGFFFLFKKIVFYMGFHDFGLVFVVKKRKLYRGWFYDQKRGFTCCQNYNKCEWRYYWYLRTIVIHHIHVMFFSRLILYWIL